MKDIHLICDKFPDLKGLNKQLKDFADLGYEPIKIFEVKKEPYDVCILVVKK